MSVGNLLLRVLFALAIVGAAIGMSAAASTTVARCDAAVATGDTVACAPAAPGATSVAGYQAAPNTADRGAAADPAFAREATALVVLASGAVFLCIFAILYVYRQRPGGVRAPDR